MPPEYDNQEFTPEQVVQLRAELDQARAEKAAAIARAEAEARRADGLYSRVADNTRQLAESNVASLGAQEKQAETAIASLTSEIASLRQQRTTLLAEGNFEAEADVSEKMAEAIAKRQRASEAKAWYAQQREQAERAPKDPVDGFLAQNNFSPEEAAWIKRHPRYATDRDFQARVNQAHAEAVRSGIAPQSEDYFKRLEDAGYMRAAPAAATPARAAAPADPADPGDSAYSSAAEPADPQDPPMPSRQSAPPAAAPSRRAPTAPRTPSAQNPRLSPEEADVALALSELYPEETLNGGDAAIYAAYQKLKNSPMAQRRRTEWSMGG